MKKIAKKLFALVLGAAMLLGILAGCSAEAPKQTDPVQNVPEVPTVSGMLVLSTAASLQITYDSEGMVIDVSGANDHGIALANGYECLGKSCSTAVKELIAASAKAGNLSRDVKNIVLKLAVGSSLPTELFLDTLTDEAEAAAKEADSSAVVTAIGLDGLDADGYINADIAKALLRNELGTEKFDAVYGDTAPHNDCYLLTVEVDGNKSSHIIDAVTGLITDAPQEEAQTDTEVTEETTPETEPSISESDKEEFVENSEEDIDVPITEEAVPQ